MLNQIKSNLKKSSIDLREIDHTKRLFLRITYLFLKNYSGLFANKKHTFITTWRRLYAKILSCTLNMVPPMLDRVLFYKHNWIFTEPFIRETEPKRRRKRYTLFWIRGVSRYLYFTTFFRRLGVLPRVTRKEAKTYKYLITSKHFNKSYVSRRYLMEEQVIRTLFGGTRPLNKKKTPFKFIFFKKFAKKVGPIRKRKLRRLSSRKLSSIVERSFPFVYYGAINTKLLKVNKKKQLFLKLLSEDKLLKRSQARNKLKEARKKYFQKEQLQKNMMRLKIFFVRLKKLKKLIKLRKLGRIKKRNIKLRKLYSRGQPRRGHSPIFYRVRRAHRRRAKRREWEKRKAAHKNVQQILDVGKRFWFRKSLRFKKLDFAKYYFLRILHWRVVDFIRTIMLIAALIEATRFVVKFYSSATSRVVRRYYHYRYYHLWFRLRRRRVQTRWKFRSVLTNKIKQYRHILFRNVNRLTHESASHRIRPRRKNWFVITLKWRKRNFYLNVFNTKKGGGIYKTSSGILGAKKKHKRRFRFVKKGLHYLLRFLIFYRRKIFKRQKKKILALYNDLNISIKKIPKHKGRLNRNRLILMATRRLMRTIGVRFTLHLIVEWFGKYDRHSLFERFIRRLRKFQIRRRRRRIKRVLTKLYWKGVRFKKIMRRRRIRKLLNRLLKVSTRIKYKRRKLSTAHYRKILNRLKIGSLSKIRPKTIKSMRFLILHARRNIMNIKRYRKGVIQRRNRFGKRLNRQSRNRYKVGQRRFKRSKLKLQKTRSKKCHS